MALVFLERRFRFVPDSIRGTQKEIIPQKGISF